MGARGPAPKPRLAVVREGNATKVDMTKYDGQVTLPPTAPKEPDWRTWFPGNGADPKAARARARETWRRIVPPLDAAGYLAEVDQSALVDLCICEARLVTCERDITRNGIWVQGERGAQKNPASTAANAYRTQLRHLYTQLYLTPAARARATTGASDADVDGSAFD